MAALELRGENLNLCSWLYILSFSSFDRCGSSVALLPIELGQGPKMREPKLALLLCFRYILGLRILFAQRSVYLLGN